MWIADPSKWHAEQSARMELVADEVELVEHLFDALRSTRTAHQHAGGGSWDVWSAVWCEVIESEGPRGRWNYSDRPTVIPLADLPARVARAMMQAEPSNYWIYCRVCDGPREVRPGEFWASALAMSGYLGLQYNPHAATEAISLVRSVRHLETGEGQVYSSYASIFDKWRRRLSRELVCGTITQLPSGVEVPTPLLRMTRRARDAWRRDPTVGTGTGRRRVRLRPDDEA